MKAYTVEFLDSGGGKFGGQKIISTRNVPAEAYRALQLYDKLMEGVMVDSSFNDNPLSSTFSNQLSSDGVANGCGSPGNISYYFIPDQPFLDACNNHDICYTTSQTKHTCDSNFLRDMLAKVDEIISLADVDGAMAEFLLNERLVKSIIGEALVKMAGLYHRAVVNTESALNAYCNSTTAYNPPECSGSESAEGTFTGVESTESVQRPGGGSVVAKCELWQFPDGDGGVYYMLRNCQYQTSV